MAGFKITVGLDDSQITKDAKAAAEKTEDAFEQHADIGGAISKSARSGFVQIGKDAQAMATKAAHELDGLTRRGVFSRLHDQAKTAFAGIANTARSVFSSVGNIITNALGVFGGNLLTSGISRLTGLLQDGAQAGINYNSTFEKITTQLTVLTGSAATAAQQIKEIKRIADATPFAFPDLAQSAATLQSFGFSAQEVEENLQAIADAGARITGTGSPAQGLQTMALVLGQIRQSTRLTMEDVRQLTSRGLPVFEIIGEQIGETAKDAKKMFDDIGFSGEVASKLLIQGFKTRPDIKGFSDELGKTFEGRMSTAADALEERLGQALKGAFEKMKVTLDLTIDLLKGEGGDKLVKVLEPKLSAPIELMNKALEALKTGNFEEFGKDAAKEFLKGLSNTLEKGIGLIYSQLVKPAMDALTARMEASFTIMLGKIETAIGKLGDKFKLPTKDELAPLTTPPAPGVKTPLERMLEFWLLHPPGSISGEAAEQGFSIQTAAFVPPQGRRKTVTGKPGTGTPQLPNIIEMPALGPQIDEVTRQNEIAAAKWAETIDKLRALYRSSRIDALTGDVAASTVQLPGVEALTERTGALEEQSTALRVNTNETNKGTVANKLSAEQLAKNRAALLLTGQAAKEVFDFGLRQTFEGMVSAVISGSVRLKDGVLGALAQIRSRVGDFIAQGLGGLLFGGGGTQGGGGSAAGGGGGGSFLGSIFGGLFGAGKGSAGSAAAIAGSGGGPTGSGGFFAGLKSLFGFGGATGSTLTSGLGSTATQAAGTGVFGGIAGGASAAGPGFGGAVGSAGAGAGLGLFGAGGFLAGIASAGPIIGLAAGSALGGKSLGGQILGGIGGTIAGAGLGLTAFAALGGTIATTGFAGAAAALLTNPFTIAIGGALLVGAYFLGKAKQRKQDETAADQIWVNEREQTRALIAAVNSDRMDGAEALVAHSQLRAQTVAQLGQIKTKSVRDSRLNNQLRDLDNTIVRELQAAVARQGKRRGIIPQLAPEFAEGGRVPGIDRGIDSVLIKARPGEVVLNQTQQARLSTIAGAGIFQKLGIPPSRSSGSSYQGGGFIGSSSGPDITISLVLESSGEQLGTLVAKGMKSSTGSRATVRVMDNARRNGEF